MNVSSEMEAITPGPIGTLMRKNNILNPEAKAAKNRWNEDRVDGVSKFFSSSTFSFVELLCLGCVASRDQVYRRTRTQVKKNNTLAKKYHSCLTCATWTLFRYALSAAVVRWRMECRLSLYIARGEKGKREKGGCATLSDIRLQQAPLLKSPGKTISTFVKCPWGAYS